MTQVIAKDGKIEGRIEVSAYVVLGYLLSEGPEDELQKVLLSRKPQEGYDVIDAENCRKLHKLFQERIERLKKNPKLSPTEIELETFEGNPNPVFPNWLFSLAQFVAEDICVAAKQNKPLRIVQKNNFPTPRFGSKSKEAPLQRLLKAIPFLKDKIGEVESYLNGRIVDYNIGRPDKPIVLVYLDRHDRQEVQDAIEVGIAKTLGLDKGKTDIPLYLEGMDGPVSLNPAGCTPGWKARVKEVNREFAIDPTVAALFMLNCDYPDKINVHGVDDLQRTMKSLKMQQLLDHARHYLDYPYVLLQFIFEGIIERSDQMAKRVFEEMTKRKQKVAFMIGGTNHWPSLADVFREKEMSTIFVLPKGAEMNAEESQKSLRPFLPAFTRKAWK